MFTWNSATRLAHRLSSWRRFRRCMLFISDACASKRFQEGFVWIPSVVAAVFEEVKEDMVLSFLKTNDEKRSM